MKCSRIRKRRWRRSFIQSTLHLDIPEDYQERLQAEPFTDCVPMLRLEFTVNRSTAHCFLKPRVVSTSTTTLLARRWITPVALSSALC